MTNRTTNNKIIIALDVEDLQHAEKLVQCLKNDVAAFKIGKQLFTGYGPEAVSMVHTIGGKLFLDLKFHDIPTTVAKASAAVVRLGVFMFNMHALGGLEMMKHTVKTVHETAAREQKQRPIILAVTILTSHSNEDLAQVGISGSTDDMVIRLALLAKEAGVDGVVASPREIELIKKACGNDFLVVTPGIRPLSSQKNDQKRTMTPREALQAGADYIIVGRPVTQAADPLSVIKEIRDEIETFRG